MFPTPLVPLQRVAGEGPVAFVAPHAPAAVSAAEPFVDADPAELAERVAEWHDEGSDVALEAAAGKLGCVGLRPVLPRALMDLNRGWRGREEAKETLFGKGALDQWVRGHAKPGAVAALEGWYRAAVGEVRSAAATARGLVELHSYGDLGSTYDKLAGGRPVRRAEAAIVGSTPWATAYPVGLARLVPGDLRGTPWALERRVGDALADAGLRVGPHPYPAQAPWSLSIRFLAARWFSWLARVDLLPQATADTLADRAWTDEQDPAIDAVVAGQDPEPEGWVGTRALAARMGAWSHDAGDLGQRFLAESGTFTLVVELRNDRVALAGAMGEAVAGAIRAYVG